MPDTDEDFPYGDPEMYMSPAELGAYRAQKQYAAEIERLRAIVRQCLAPGFNPDEDAADGVTVREVILKDLER